MGEAAWDIAAICASLGGEYRQQRADHHQLLLTNEPLGIRLKMDLYPQKRLVRLWCDRRLAEGPTFVGRTEVFLITYVETDPVRGETVFRTTDPRPAELLVTRDATFYMTVAFISEAEIDSAFGPEQVPAAQSEDSAVSPTDDVITLVGRLARPHYSDHTGRPFFTAGLAQYPDGAVHPVWHNLKAFGGVAKSARDLQRGQMVRLSGKPRAESFLKDGEERTSTSILLTYIEAA